MGLRGGLAGPGTVPGRFWGGSEGLPGGCALLAETASDHRPRLQGLERSGRVPDALMGPGPILWQVYTMRLDADAFLDLDGYSMEQPDDSCPPDSVRLRYSVPMAA